MQDLLLIFLLFGGFALSGLTALVLQSASHYYGYHSLSIAAMISAFSICALTSLALGLTLTLISFTISLARLLMPLKDSKLRKPIFPALVLCAANVWNAYVIFLASDSSFMGGDC